MTVTLHKVDFLVVGSGIAGLTFALEVSKEGSTVMLTKKNRAESSSNYAQGGIAGVMANDDSFALHLQDTLVAGAGLCHEDAVNVLVHEGPDRIRDLIDLGAQFNTEHDGTGRMQLSLGREGGHSRNRIVYAVDHTGWECERTLLAAAKDAPNLQILDHYFVVDLITTETSNGEVCVGAWAIDASSQETHTFYARAVLLATGGCGQLYKHTTNPSIATADGVAMAWRAGAEIGNMEFIQFHPTSLYHPDGHSFLISEAVRGEGGILRTSRGDPFMENYHPLKDLAPRDIVARAIHAERQKLGDPCVYLDVTHLDAHETAERFPTIYQRCLSLGIDMTSEPIPVVPAAHYMCGGVTTDLMGRTTIRGLYGAGEVACTGVHGANRLASNSLLEAMVFGRRAASAVLSDDLATVPEESEPPKSQTKHPRSVGNHEHIRVELKNIMNDKVGIVRSTAELTEAKRLVGKLFKSTTMATSDVDELEARNMCTSALLIIECALRRHESRGLHYILDYPDKDSAAGNPDTIIDPSKDSDWNSIQ